MSDQGGVRYGILGFWDFGILGGFDGVGGFLRGRCKRDGREKTCGQS